MKDVAAMQLNIMQRPLLRRGSPEWGRGRVCRSIQLLAC
jgi:hypothetical protein